MPQPLPPTRRIKLKDKSLLAILLAVLLHILIAIIIYFSLFHHEQPTAALPTITDNQSVIPTAVIPKTEKLSPIDQKDPKVQDTTLPDSKEKANSTTPVDTDTVKANQSTEQSKDKTPALTPDRETTKAPKPNREITKAPKPSRDTTKEPVSTPVMKDSKVNTIESPTTSPNTSSNQAEYKLKQTKETLQLDEEIDKDSEQLSKLIGEVKKRNQTQIQQHQLPKANQRPVDNAPTVQYDYPITPISPLPTSKNNEGNKPVDPQP